MEIIKVMKDKIQRVGRVGTLGLAIEIGKKIEKKIKFNVIKKRKTQCVDLEKKKIIY